MKRLILISAIVVYVSLLCGCYDYSEPNDMVYATAIGIDVGTQNNKEITLQYAKAADINSGAEGGGDILGTVTVTAPTVYSAVSMANHTMSKRFSLSHVKLIVFSEETAREGVEDFANLISGSDELRPYIFTAVSSGSARKYLESVQPGMEINPIKYYEMIYNGDDSAYMPYMDTQTFCADIRSESDMVLPIASANYSVGEGTYNQYDIFGYGSAYGDTENSDGVMGMALFSGDKLTGMCGGAETELYNMLSGNFHTGHAAFYDTARGNTISVLLQRARKPRIRADIKGENPKVDIDLYLDAELEGAPAEYCYEDELSRLETEMSEDIRLAIQSFLKKTQTQYNCDVLNVGTYIRRKFLTLYDYKSYDFKNRYNDVEFNVNVNLSLSRTGAVVRESEGHIND